MNDQLREFTLPVAVSRFRAETSVFGVQNERYCTSTSVLWNMCKKFQPDPASAQTQAPAGLLSAFEFPSEPSQHYLGDSLPSCSQLRNPAWHSPAVFVIRFPKLSPERGLLVEHHE